MAQVVGVTWRLYKLAGGVIYNRIVHLSGPKDKTLCGRIMGWNWFSEIVDHSDVTGSGYCARCLKVYQKPIDPAPKQA